MALSFMVLLVAVLAAGWVALEIGARGWVPELLVILALGFLSGPAGLGILHVTAATFWVHDALVLGAALLLFEGARDIPPRALAPLVVSVSLLSTLGVVVTALVSALAARFLAGLPWPAALVFGAAVAATDPAATAALLREGRLAPRIRTVLLAEAAFNDAVALALVPAALALFAAGGAAHAVTPVRFAIALVRDGLVGVAAGLAVTAVAKIVRRHSGDVVRRHAALLILLAVTAAYVLGTVARGSGFVAVFVLGIGLRGDAEREGAAVGGRSFGEAANALVRVVVFFLLGAALDPRALWSLPLVTVLAVPAVLVLIARPLAVALSLLPDRRPRWSRSEGLILAASRPTGVVPAVLAAFLAASSLRGAHRAAALVVACIFVTLVLTALVVPALARRTGLVESPSSLR